MSWPLTCAPQGRTRREVRSRQATLQSSWWNTVSSRSLGCWPVIHPKILKASHCSGWQPRSEEVAEPRHCSARVCRRCWRPVGGHPKTGTVTLHRAEWNSASFYFKTCLKQSRKHILGGISNSWQLFSFSWGGEVGGWRQHCFDVGCLSEWQGQALDRSFSRH